MPKPYNSQPYNTMHIYKLSAPDESTMLDFIESLTGSREQFAMKLANGIHNCVQLGHVVEDETTPVLSERFHTDIMSEVELTLPDGITRHYPTSPVHGFAGL
jgi:Ni,Fe-hydrogenase III large subunit